MTWQVSQFRIGLLSDSNLVESQIFALWEKRKRIIGKCFEISNWNVALGYLDFSNKEKFLELEGGTLFLNRRKGSLIFCSRRKINLFEADIVADSKDENFKGSWSKNLASGRDLHRWGGLKNIPCFSFTGLFTGLFTKFTVKWKRNFRSTAFLHIIECRYAPLLSTWLSTR